MRLDYRYCLTEDGTKLVRDTDPLAHSLLYPAGTEISQEEADKWGLKKPKVDKPEATKVVKPTSKEGGVVAYPTYADLQAFALTAGIVASTDDHLDYRGTIAAAIAQWESDTGWSPFLASNPSELVYDAPRGRILHLRGGVLEIGGDVLYHGVPVAYDLMPQNAPTHGRPYIYLRFRYPLCGGASAISITGAAFGYCYSLPADVREAILSLGALMLVPVKAQANNGAGAVTMIRQDDLQINYASVSGSNSHYSAQQLQLKDAYDATVLRYVRAVVL